MGVNSKIEWCDHTMNFWIGCQEVSPACVFCYAKTQNAHWKWVNGWGPHGERKRTVAANWHKLRKWNRDARAAGVRAKVFSNSLSDFFDSAAPYIWRREAWHYIEQSPDLDFLILTKRPQNIAKMLPDPETGVKPWGAGWPNVWLGTTVENQEEADRRIPHLLAVPATARFLSCEPMLGPVNLHPWLPGDDGCEGCDDGDGWGPNCHRKDIPREHQCPRNFAVYHCEVGPRDASGCPEWVGCDRIALDWVICGGEVRPERSADASGLGARAAGSVPGGRRPVFLQAVGRVGAR